jgi:hypothetical protein
MPLKQDELRRFGLIYLAKMEGTTVTVRQQPYSRSDTSRALSPCMNGRAHDKLPASPSQPPYTHLLLLASTYLLVRVRTGRGYDIWPHQGDLLHHANANMVCTYPRAIYGCWSTLGLNTHRLSSLWPRWSSFKKRCLNDYGIQLVGALVCSPFPAACLLNSTC